MTQPYTAPLQQNKNNNAHQAFFIYGLILKGKTSNLPAQPRKTTHVAVLPPPHPKYDRSRRTPAAARPSTRVGINRLNELLIFPVLQDFPNPGCQF